MALLFLVNQDSRPVTEAQIAYYIISLFTFPIRGVGFSVHGSTIATSKQAANLIVHYLCNYKEV